MSIRLGSPSFAKFAKSTATTVYLMTAVKAVVRPAFNLADKKSDKNARKYSATNECLYQVLCLGFAFAMIPFFEKGGMMLAEKQLKKVLSNKNITKLSQLDEFKKLENAKGFGLSGFKNISEFKKIYLDNTFAEKSNLSKDADKAMHLINGGIETGSLIGSIIGLTILAPKIGHEILHPIMKHLGMDKKEKDIGTPNELFLADAKVPVQGNNVNVKA